MSADSWESDLAGLTARLGQSGTIDASQAEMLTRLVSEVGALTRGRLARRPGIIVRTAVALAPEERAELEKALTRRFGLGQPITFEVDPQVLGGVWLRVGDRIIDGSLRGRLEALRKQMA